MASIRSFIFDIGNVLIPFDFTRALQRIETQCPIPFDHLPTHAKPIAEAYESGQIGRAEFLRTLIAAIEYRGTEAELVAAWEDIFEENQAMTRLVAQLHGHYPLFLLSNTSDIHVDYFTGKYPVFQYFSDAVYSHVARCMKPGHRIFEIAIQQFNVIPAETVYIDDLPANVAAARELGFEALLYHHQNHPALLKTLATLGVSIAADSFL